MSAPDQRTDDQRADGFAAGTLLSPASLQDVPSARSTRNPNPHYGSPMTNIHMSCLHPGCQQALGGSSKVSFVSCCGDEGVAGHAAVCLSCFSAPHRKSENKKGLALVQLASRKVGVAASSLDFGEGLPAIKDGQVLAYVTYSSADKTGQLVCVDCWENGARALGERAVPRPAAHRLDLGADQWEEAQVSLQSLVHELPQDVDITRRAAASVMSCESPSVASPPLDSTLYNKVLRILLLDESNPAFMQESLAAFLLNSSVPFLLVEEASRQLRWNAQGRRFDGEVSVADWRRFIDDLQQAVTDLVPVASVKEVDQELARFSGRAAIILEEMTQESVVMVSGMAQRLSVSAQGRLVAVGFDQHLHGFPLTVDPDLLRQQLTDRFAGGGAQRAGFSQLSVASRPEGRPPFAAPPKMLSQPSLQQQDWGAVSDSLQAMGLDKELAQRQELLQQARNRGAQMSPVVPWLEASKVQPETSATQGGSEHDHLTKLFQVHLLASDLQRTTGAHTHVGMALTLFESFKRLRAACVANTKSSSLLWMPDAGGNKAEFDLTAAFTRTLDVCENITYMHAFTSDDLHAYLALAKSYLQQHAPSMVETFQSLKSWILGQKNQFLTSFGIRAPTDPNSKEKALHLALGRLYFVRRQAMSWVPGKGVVTLANIDREIAHYQDSQQDMSRGDAFRKLLADFGFKRVTPQVSALLTVYPNSDTGADNEYEADRKYAQACRDGWKDINSKVECKNCGAANLHSAGYCNKPRRVGLPCQLCYGCSDAPHHEPVCPGANDMVRWSRLAVMFWRERLGTRQNADRTSHGGGAGNGV